MQQVWRLKSPSPLAEDFESPREVVGRFEGEVHAVGEFDGLAAEAGFEEGDAGEGVPGRVWRSNAPEVVGMVSSCDGVLDGAPLEEVACGDVPAPLRACAVVVARFSGEVDVDGGGDNFIAVAGEIEGTMRSGEREAVSGKR